MTSAKVHSIEEHSDGSATYLFDIAEDMIPMLTSIGLKFSLYCLGKNLTVDQGFEALLTEISKKVD